MQEAHEVGILPVKPGGDATEMLQLVEAALNPVAGLSAFLVKRRT